MSYKYLTTACHLLAVLGIACHICSTTAEIYFQFLSQLLTVISDSIIFVQLLHVNSHVKWITIN